jgi:glycosyltransferase involved in cell wall biosynthesis
LSEPLVSIVIPLYNKSDWIIPTLISVTRQEHSNWECIIVDDGSTDDSLDIVNKFVEINKGNWKIVAQPNSGQAIARNYGISLSRGKYIAMLDADDIWFTAKLKKQVKFMEQNPEIDLLYCSYVIFEEGLNKTFRIIRFTNSQRMVTRWLKMLGFGGLIESVSMIRRTHFDNIGMFDPELSTSSGLDIAIKSSLYSKTKVLKDVLVGYRISDNQWHKNFDELIRNCVHLSDKYGDLVDSKFRVKKYQDAYLSYNSKRANGLSSLLLVLWGHFLSGNFAGVKMFFAIASRNVVAYFLGFLATKKMAKEITNSQGAP